MARVSVVIPCYNAEPRIFDCLNSVANQTHGDLEVIIVDNNSTDNSLEIIHQFCDQQNKLPYRRWIALSHGQPGAHHCRNFALQQSTGDYIQFLDADDTLSSPRKITTQLADIEERKADVAYCHWFWNINQIRLPVIAETTNNWLLNLALNNWVPPHAYLLHSSVVEPWQPEGIRFNDREYFLKIATRNPKVVLSSTYVDYYWWSPNQNSRKPQTLQEECDRLAGVFSRTKSFYTGDDQDTLAVLDAPWTLWEYNGFISHLENHVQCQVTQFVGDPRYPRCTPLFPKLKLKVWKQLRPLAERA